MNNCTNASRKNIIFILLLVFNMLYGVSAYGGLIQLLSDKTQYLSYNEDGIIDSAVFKPAGVDSVSVGGTLIPANAYKSVKLPAGEVVDMARVIFLDPNASTRIKTYYITVGLQTGIIVLEVSSGKLEIVAGEATYVKYLLGVDLDVDSNRDGTINESGDSDEIGEYSFNKDRGAIILNNADRDKGSDAPDNSDNIINGSDDRRELSKLRLGGSGLDAIPTNIRYLLEVSEIDSENIRIFDGYTTNSSELLGPATGNTDSDRPDKKYIVLDNNWLIGDAGKMLSAEALKYIGDPWSGSETDFDGEIEISLVVQTNISGTWTDIGRDVVLFQVAPVVFAWNGQAIKKVFAYSAIEDDIDASLTADSTSDPGAPWSLSGYSQWYQDFTEIGNSYYSKQICINTYVDLNHVAADGWTFDLAEQEKGAYIERANDGQGGGIEVTPPTSKYPLGRLITSGSSVNAPDCYSAKVKEFVNAQKVQAPAIHIYTNWLSVGHIDEIISFIPHGDGAKVLIPSPKEAVDILYHRILKLGLGTREMHIGAEEVPEQDISVLDLAVLKRKRFYSGDLSVYLQGNVLTDNGTVLTVSPGYLDIWQGDIIRVGDEYIQVTDVVHLNDIIRIWGNRGYLGSTAASHQQDTYLFMLSEQVLENFETVHPTLGTASDNCERAAQEVAAYLGGDENIIRLPVLFDGLKNGNSYINMYQALTPDVVNCLVAEGKLFMTAPKGPIGQAETKTFEFHITTQLGGVAAPVFIEDGWLLHMGHGEIHCGSNSLREPIENWWEAWK